MTTLDTTTALLDARTDTQKNKNHNEYHARTARHARTHIAETTLMQKIEHSPTYAIWTHDYLRHVPPCLQLLMTTATTSTASTTTAALLDVRTDT